MNVYHVATLSGAVYVYNVEDSASFLNRVSIAILNRTALVWESYEANNPIVNGAYIVGCKAIV